MLACDLVVAARTAEFGLPEVRRGLLPTCGALFRRAAGDAAEPCRELILTGDPIGAERAYAAGFVNVLSEPGEAVDAAVALAERLCLNAPLSVQACLAAVNALVGVDDADGWDATAAALDSLLGTSDMAEGVQAFFEKRPPEWTVGQSVRRERPSTAPDAVDGEWLVVGFEHHTQAVREHRQHRVLADDERDLGEARGRRSARGAPPRSRR